MTIFETYVELMMMINDNDDDEEEEGDNLLGIVPRTQHYFK